jgi:hypothetical protein
MSEYDMFNHLIHHLPNISLAAKYKITELHNYVSEIIRDMIDTSDIIKLT